MVWHKFIRYTGLPIVLFCVILIIYIHFELKPPFEIKSYEKEIKNLASQIVEEMRKERISGTVNVLREIEGANEQLRDKILPVFEESLLSGDYRPFTFIVPPEEYENKIRTLRETWERRKVPETEIQRRIKSYRQEYTLEPDLQITLQKKEINPQKRLIGFFVTVTRRQTVKRFSTEFTDPSFEDEWNKKVHRMTILKKISTGSIFLFTFIIFISEVFYRVKRKNIIKDRAIFIEKLKRYMEGGHYCAAEALLKNYLSILPDDSDMLAIKRQLMLITKGNCKRAEEGYKILQ